MKTRKVFIALLATTLLFSCNKEEEQKSEPIPTSNDQVTRGSDWPEDHSIDLESAFANEGINIDNVQVLYFIDGEQTDAPIDVTPDMNPIYSSTKNEAEQSAIIYIRTFTSLDKFYEYGDANNIPLRATDEFAEIMHQYAADNNLVDMEDIDQLPAEYYEFENRVYEHYFGSRSRALFYQYYDDFVPYGPVRLIFTPTFPLVCCNWSNRFGGVISSGLVLAGTYWDKNFYDDRIGTITGWGFSFAPFHPMFGTGAFNNRIQSGLQWG